LREEVDLAGIDHMPQLVGVNFREPVDEADLQRVAGHRARRAPPYGDTMAAAPRATQSRRRPRADLIDLSGGDG